MSSDAQGLPLLTRRMRTLLLRTQRTCFLTRLLTVLITILLTAHEAQAQAGDNNTRSSRQKRVAYYTTDRRLAFPPGTGFAIDFKISMPFQRKIPEGIETATNLELPFGIDFDTLRWTSDENPYFILPWEYLDDPKERKRKKRQLPYGGDRRLFYQMIEDYLSNIGMNGQACLLRAICETHELPFYSQGFLGEVLRLLLTASLAQDLPESIDVYLEAEKMGSSYLDCSKFRKRCRHTIFTLRSSDTNKDKENRRKGKFLYYTTDRRLAFPPKTNAYIGASFFINNFRGAYTGTSMSMSITAGVGMDFDALYLTSPEHPFAPIDYDLEEIRRKRNAPDDLPAANLAGGDRELMYPAVEEHFRKFGLDGKACLLRIICEAQERPIKSYNFIGEILMHFLRPSKAFKPERRLHEYMAAENAGKKEKDCSAYYSACSKSFFVDVPKYKIKKYDGIDYIKEYMNNTNS